MEIQQFHDCRKDSFDEMVFMDVTFCVILFTKKPRCFGGASYAKLFYSSYYAALHAPPGYSPSPD